MENVIKDIKDVRDQIQVLQIEQDRLYEDLIDRVDLPHEDLESAIKDYVLKNHRFRMYDIKDELTKTNL
jgi:hypothetical protein|tara:strand:- start:1771 stop:1977 length:207 start_codon:yes stop_codon:yes gene_type:complete